MAQTYHFTLKQVFCVKLFLTRCYCSLYFSAMAYEKECDQALLAISKDNGSTDGTVYCAVKEHGRILTDNEIVIITSILISNKFIRSNLDRHDVFSQGSEFYFMTDKGFEFLNTDTFVDRNKRWELERKLKEQQSTLNTIELGLKPYTFLIAVLGLGVAIVAVIISFVALSK